ncbi:MAG: LacI family DNA-binding transcriptional regulator [Sarcina sp.]
MTSISDIAKKASVAKSTVSRVLNNHPHVSDKTREKVISVIAEFDYSPSQLARDLSRGKTQKIGVVIPHTRHPYFTNLINGQLDIAKETDYQLVMMPSDYNHQLEISYLEQLRNGAIDALIFTSRAISLDIIKKYSKYGQLVLLEELQKKQNISCVFVDRFQAYIEVFKNLQDNGLKYPVLLFSRNTAESATFNMAMRAYKEVYGNNKVINLGDIDTFEDGYSIVYGLQSLSNIDSILANSDDVAAGVISCYQSLGLQTPYIIGQENQLSSQLLNISTIEHHSYELGKLSVKQALAKNNEQIRLVSTFIKRN